MLGVSERRACRVIGQPRATQRYDQHQAEDEDQLREQIVNLASKYGRYGYRRVTALLQEAGWPSDRNGIPVFVVSRRLGHAKASITLDVYGHLIPSMQAEAAELMDELIMPVPLQFNQREIIR